MGKTYFVSNCGKDENDGLTEQTPVASIARINELVRGGDTVLFRSGDVFYGGIRCAGGINATEPTVLSAYGEGVKPIISQYKCAVRKENWEKVSERIWRLDLTESSVYSGNTTDINTNVGFLKVGGVIHGRKQFQRERLHRDWDFYNDEKYVYVCSENNPAEYGKVEIACDILCVLLVNNLVVSDLDICGSGGHGIRGSARNVVIKNCDIHELGGSELAHHIADTRYGNGVELWSDSANITVTGNRLYDIYDVAITMQGNQVMRGWENITITDNIMWNNEQSLELWSDGEIPDTGFRNCRFEGNICIGAGRGWSHMVRPDRNVAVHLLLYNLICPVTELMLRHNVFYDAHGGLYSKSGATYEIPEGYDSDENYIFLREGQEICTTGPRFVVEEHDKFSLYLNREMHSEFAYILSDVEEKEDLITKLWRLKH